MHPQSDRTGRRLREHGECSALGRTAAHLGAVFLPQRRDEPLHSLVLHRDLVHMQVHAVPKAQLLQLLGEKAGVRTKGYDEYQAVQVGVAHRGHTALERWRQEQEFEVILSYTEKLKAASAT